MKLKLARLLKLKNTLKGEIAKLGEMVARNNSYPEMRPANFDAAALFKERAEKVAMLNKVKAAIARANNPIVDVILDLGETKSLLSFLEEIPTKAGDIVERYDAENRPVVEKWKAVITAQEVDAQRRALEKRVEVLQEQLDTFNATTEVEIDINL